MQVIGILLISEMKADWYCYFSVVCILYVQSVIETLEEQDVEAFTNTVKEYDSIARLDPW